MRSVLVMIVVSLVCACASTAKQSKIEKVDGYSVANDPFNDCGLPCFEAPGKPPSPFPVAFYCKDMKGCFDLASVYCGMTSNVVGYSGNQSRKQGSWHSVSNPTPDDPEGNNMAVWDSNKNEWYMLVECKDTL